MLKKLFAILFLLFCLVTMGVWVVGSHGQLQFRPGMTQDWVIFAIILISFGLFVFLMFGKGKKSGMYVEIEKVGSLDKALDLELAKINSAFRVKVDEDLKAKFPIVYARVENENKFSQIYIAAERKLYLPDFWRDGVCLANGSTPDINQLAMVIDYWLGNNITTKALYQKFPFVTPDDKAHAFDIGREVEYSWHQTLNHPPTDHLKEAISLAMDDEVLSKLFPFTSLNRLCFSKCTGYPYTNDIATINPVDKGYFEVRLPNNQLLGSGTAAEALKILKDSLPANIGPAVKGTAEDLLK
jgi:hypothetical protein